MLEVASAAAATVNEASLKGILRNGGAVKAYRTSCGGEKNTAAVALFRLRQMSVAS